MNEDKNNLRYENHTRICCVSFPAGIFQDFD